MPHYLINQLKIPNKSYEKLKLFIEEINKLVFKEKINLSQQINSHY